jgi:hypothetical protein
VFLISLYSRFDNYPRILNHREYSVIHYIFYFFFLNWIHVFTSGLRDLQTESIAAYFDKLHCKENLIENSF